MLIFGEHDDATIAQMKLCMETGSAASGVLCADGHLGYNHPIGGVIGYTDHISLSGVGFDIGCGNMAVQLDICADDIVNDLPKIMKEIQATIGFGVGRSNAESIDHALFYTDRWRNADVSNLKNMARSQLGTVGSGNHYVDVFIDMADASIWVGVHFGSRGLGHKITTKYMAMMGASDSMLGAPCLLEADSDIGRAYMEGVELGGEYAYAGREWVVNRVNQIIGGNVVKTVHNHHNFCWKENHDGVDMWVVRKGATPAFPNQLGFIGGSQGDNAVIIRGVDSPLSAKSLYSTVHGAGRVMSRTDARGKVHKKTGEVIREPRITHSEWQEWIERKGVIVLGSDVDEAPQAYRRLPDVLDHHAGTIEVLHTLQPIGVVMAGSKEFDPYKD